MENPENPGGLAEICFVFISSGLPTQRAHERGPAITAVHVKKPRVTTCRIRLGNACVPWEVIMVYQ